MRRSTRRAGAGRGAAGGAGAQRIVIGAGPTGLSAAYHLGEDRSCIEQNDRVGGWCRSIEDDGFTFDYAGHIMFSNDPYVHQLYQHAARRQRPLAGSRGVDLQQGRVHALSVPGLALRAAAGGDQGMHRGRDRGAVRDAETAPKRGTPTANGERQRRTARAATPAVYRTAARTACWRASAPLVERPRRPAARRGISRSSSTRCGARASPSILPFPTTASSGRCRWSEMETSWLGGRVPLPDLEEMIEGALSPVAQADGTQRALRISAARRIPGADGWLAAASERRAAPE